MIMLASRVPGGKRVKKLNSALRMQPTGGWGACEKHALTGKGSRKEGPVGQNQEGSGWGRRAGQGLIYRHCTSHTVTEADR